MVHHFIYLYCAIYMIYIVVHPFILKFTISKNYFITQTSIFFRGENCKLSTQLSHKCNFYKDKIANTSCERYWWRNILFFTIPNRGMIIHCAIVKQTKEEKSVEEYSHVKDNKEGVYIMSISLWNLNFYYNNKYVMFQ